MEADFLPALSATVVGSLPHQDLARAINLITVFLPDTPFWPQLSKYSPLENMITQVSLGLPFLNYDEERGEIFFADEREMAFFSVSAEVIRKTWKEVITAGQAQGALVGIHCWGKTDWSLLSESKVNVINFGDGKVEKANVSTT